ncbi:glycosyltransferase family 2 protein [Candidatus Zixiibacteriota bacterium]
MSQASPTITVVVVTYNSARDIAPCLQAVARSTCAAAVQTVVVDNASTDGTAYLVAGEFPDVQLIKNQENRYYAAACNQGAKAGGGEYLLLLNPDVQLAEDTLQKLFEYLEAHPDVAAVAPKLIWPDGKIQPSVRTFPTYSTLWCEITGLSRLFPRHPVLGRWRVDLRNVHTPIDVDQPMASCFLVRREIWDNLGGFDESFPMFFNDVDLCYRLKKSGGRIVYLPHAIATHRLGGSVRPAMARMVWFSHRGFLRYLGKHHLAGFNLLKYIISAPVFMAAALARSFFWLLRKEMY